MGTHVLQARNPKGRGCGYARNKRVDTTPSLSGAISDRPIPPTMRPNYIGTAVVPPPNDAILQRRTNLLLARCDNNKVLLRGCQRAVI
jgi:hypothetical protein